ncbi:Hypothetical predicted protein [Olea europaea subsp. europaea]|uniref:Uncharacterized protein n=1 Tax=Olea europaea subsp. europaea TaxID=158383 RepID=A0A8S0S4I4_OLEEU|nr:Hypothetical predicted protein [Olea europaea subsp. europaea]
MFSRESQGKVPENPLLFACKYINPLSNGIAGNDPEKKLFPRSKYLRETHIFNSSVTGPNKKLNPRESFSRDFSLQMESKGIEPVKFCLESSISMTALFESQVIPEKLHMGLVDSQESNTLVLDSCKADFMDRSVCSSLAAAAPAEERKKRRQRN